MSPEITGQFVTHIFATYGPAALPLVVMYYVIRYLLDKDKERETAHKLEIAAERKRGDDLQTELLKEARGNATLSEDVKTALQLLAKGA